MDISFGRLLASFSLFGLAFLLEAVAFHVDWAPLSGPKSVLALTAGIPLGAGFGTLLRRPGIGGFVGLGIGLLNATLLALVNFTPGP
jgi:hypothetical protein